MTENGRRVAHALLKAKQRQKAKTANKWRSKWRGVGRKGSDGWQNKTSKAGEKQTIRVSGADVSVSFLLFTTTH